MIKRIKMRSLVISLILVATLLGCQTSAPPLRSEAGKSVTLELAELSNYDQRFGFVSVMQDDYDCYGFAEGTKTAEMPKTKTYSVAGRRFLTIGTEYFKGKFLGPIVESELCAARYTFPITPGGHYRVEVANASKGCSTVIYEIQDQNRVPLQLYKRVSAKAPSTDGKGPWCQADDRFRGSSSYVVPR